TLDTTSTYPLLQRGDDRYAPVSETITKSTGETTQDPTTAWKGGGKVGIPIGVSAEVSGEYGQTNHGTQHQLSTTNAQTVNIYPGENGAHWEERRTTGNYNGGSITVTGQDSDGNPAPVQIDDDDSYAYYPNPQAQTANFVVENNPP